jgi:RNA polymerase sigma-70 factor (ECF subfamily)
VSEAAFDLAGLYRRHAAEVRRFALHLSGDPSTAEDITSETFVRLYGAREREEIRSMRAYLLAIARNLYLQGRRGQRRTDEIHETLPDPAPSVERTRAARRELARTLDALQQLPELDRAALLLRAQEELPYDEIAAALGITPVAARVRIHRARARLAAILKETER